MCSALFRFILFLAATCGAVHGQQNWQWLNTLPASSEWKEVAHGNGLYVVVGGDGTIISSVDAATWTVRRMPTGSEALNAVAFADGRFVAVGMGGAATGAALVLTSTDGLAWTVNDTVNTTISAQLADVAHGNGTWVISGASQNRVLTSSDGLSWTVRAAGANTGDIAFGGGKFVALTNNNKAIVSTDGITWTSTTIAAATSLFFQGIAYGNNQFVVGGSGSDFKAISYTSPDGVTWTAGTTVADSSGGGSWLAFTNNVYVMGGGGGFDVLSSSNGTMWTKRDPSFPQTRKSSPNSVGTENVGGVGAANNLLFAFGIYGTISTSSNGATWTRRSSGTAHDINGFVHDGTKFVGVGTGGTVVTSADGVTWTASSTNFTGWFGQLAYGNGRYVASSMDGLWHSTDLTTWTRVANTAFNQMSGGVIRANNTFVAAANGISLGLWVSLDGATWTNPKISGASGSVQALAGGGGKFVLALGGFGATPKIFTSSDATTWVDSTPAGFTGTPDSAAYANGRFVVLVGNTAWVSADGATWNSGPLPAANFALVTDVMALNGKFIARKFPSFVSSADGLTWTTIENSVTPNVVVTSMVAQGSYVYITGGGGAILRGTLEGAAAPQTLTATVPAAATVQWQRNGASLTGATSASYTVESITPETAGIYSAAITSGGTTTLESSIVGVSTTQKLVGTGTEYPNITHQNGNIFDQILLESATAAFTADAAENQITRLSYVDMSNDIVQVEFSGAGTVSIILEGATTPAEAASYDQPGTHYLKGHATIVVTGANETSNITIFSVGRITAVNQALFKADVTYDGYADIAAVAIQSTNGKFGTMKSGNTSFWNTQGLTGIYAPGVTFQGEIFIHDINAREAATPVFMIGGAKETRLTGGDLAQENSRAVRVAGLTTLQLTAGTNSHGTLMPAQTNQGRLERDGIDVTADIIR